LRRWEEDGFVILRGLFSDDRVRSTNAFVDRLWKDRRALSSALTVDVQIESSAQRRLLLSEADDRDRHRPYKINDLYLEFSNIRDLVLDKDLCEVLEHLLSGTPMVCNTLNFEYGSQQADHIDTLYMPSRKAGGMVASWIALDRVGKNNGPLRYWPGSHRIPPYYFSHGKTNAIAEEMSEFNSYVQREVKQRDLKPITLEAEPGDVMIWHSQLLHGGCSIKDHAQTRRSLVTHYFRRQDYRHHFWRLRRHHANGYFYRRRHQAIDAASPSS
jgi:ectoine hydroxylase-related dioxygenase (phytanoyl-CoA dioxygenase family)